MLNHMFHLCLFGVCSTLLQKVHFALANCTAGRVSMKSVFFTHVIVNPFFAVHVFLYQLANADTSCVVLCMCNVYYTWYIQLVLYVYLCSSALRRYSVVSIHGAFMEVCSVALSLTCICCVGLPIYWKGGCLLTQCDYDLCMCMHWL